MFRMIRQFTFNRPKEILWPTLWFFIAQAFSVIPAILTFMGIYVLGSAFMPPYTLDFQSLVHLAVLGGICFILHYGIELLSFYQTYHRAYRETAAKRIEYIHALRKQALGFFHTRESGELISSFATDFANVEFTMCYWLPYPIGVGFLLILSFVFIAFYNIEMALAMFVLFPVCGIMMFFASKLKARHGKEVLDAKANASSQVQEYLGGMKELKTYKMTGEGFASLKQAYRSLQRSTVRDELIAGSLFSLCARIVGFLVPISVVFGVYYTIGGRMTAIDLAAFLVLASKLSEPALMVITCLGQLRSMALSGNRLEEVMTSAEQGGDKEIDNGESYTFDALSFSYNENGETLKDLSFHTPKREISALIGPSGSGKSTILNLMVRFWDYQKGNISLDNHELKEIRSESLLTQVTMLVQHPYLFRGTVRENICFGNMEIEERDLIKACKKARCHNFISALSYGYDTFIEEGGKNLSGGEKQRIALARAFLKDAPILLLDEPTSSLDADNEKAVQEALDEIAKDRTVVIIAHRLKTVRNAKQILFIEDGKLLDKGKHEELLERSSRYKHMWDLQNQAAEFHFSS